MENLAKKKNDFLAPWDTDDTIRARRRMVEEQILRRGIHNPRVLEAFYAVPRHLFIPEAERNWAYVDGPLPLGFGQTISQPYIVSVMTDVLRLRGDEKVLEIGTGSGYQAAILSRLAFQVFTIERIGELAQRARESLHRIGVNNVMVIHGNGTLGLPKEAPFDAIVVTAAAPDIPDQLMEQLADSGRLVLPIGDRDIQTLIKITKSGGTTHRESLGMCVFVPLIGREGWEEGAS